MPSRRPTADYILSCFSCVDVWRSELGAEFPNNPSFKLFEAWVSEAYKRDETPQEVTNLMKLLVFPNDPTSYTHQALQELLHHRSNGRDFRVIISSDIDNNGDYRVRDFLTALLQQKKIRRDFNFTVTALQCQAYGDRVGLQTCPSSGKSPFSTIPLTRFEQVLFLGAVAHLSAIFKSEMRSRKRKWSPDGQNDRTLPQLPSLKGLGGNRAQVVANAIQHIVYGWNYLAQSLGFKDTQDLVLPYTQVTRNSVHFRAVENRQQGFVPLSQAKRLQFDVQLTTQRDETFTRAYDFSLLLDKKVRELVRIFYSDFYSILESDAVYSSTTGPWSHLKEYEKTGQGLPKRFDRLPNSLTKDIKKGMEEGNWLPRQSNAPSEQENQVPVNHPDQVLPDVNPTIPSSSSNVAPLNPLTDEELKKHMETLEDAGAKYLRMINCPFDDIIEYHDLLFKDDIHQKVQLLLMDPPYNIRRTRGDDDASHDLLTKEQMSNLVDISAMLLKPGGYVILFCTIQQFSVWEQLFKKHTSEGKETFLVSKTPIVFAWHPSVHRQFPGRRSFSLVNSVEYAIHVKKKGQSKEEGEEHVNYHNFNYVASDYPAYKNIITNVRGLIPGEQLRVPTADNSKTKALRPEQKPIALLKQLISQWTQPGDLVADLFGGTYSCGMSCLDLDKHRRFVGCEIDEVCHNYASNHMMRRLATKIVENANDMAFSDEVHHAAREIHTRYMAKPVHDKNWSAPDGLPQYQSLPPHIVSFVASSISDTSFFLRYKDRGIHDWPRQMQGLLNHFDVTILRNLDAAACGLMIAKSRIRHKNAGLGAFATKMFSPGETIGSFYGTLVYTCLTKKGLDSQKTYGTGILGVTPKYFMKYAIQVPVEAMAFSKVKELTDGKKSVFVVPAPFSACGYINDMRYLLGDEEKDASESGLARKRQANVIFDSEPYPVSSPNHLIPFKLQSVKAKTYINPGEELYIDYASDDSALETDSF